MLKFIIALVIFSLFNNSSFANNVGKETGFKLPRYVSLKSSDVNLRVGPSKNYPLILRYTTKNLPLEIIDENGLWREIRDFNGNKGWIKKNLLKGDRYVIFTIKNYIYIKPNGKIIGEIGKLNILKINKCLVKWCSVKYNQYDGWVKKIDIWGVYKDEKINIKIYQPIIDFFFFFF